MTSISRPPINTADTFAYTDLHSLQKINQEQGDAALRQVAKQFESMFVHMLFKGMRDANAVFEEGNFGHSSGETMYREMYDQQMSLNIAEGKGLGIADMVFRQLKGSDRRAPDLNSEGLRAFDAASVKPSEQHLLENKDSAVNSVNSTNVNPTQTQVRDLPNKTPEEFIKSLYPVAKRLASSVGLDPAIMVAQAALETGWGKHVVGGAQKISNNLFNIKADSRWQGAKVNTQTLEYKNGVAVKEQAHFRKYSSIEDSIQDFMQFIQDQPRYQSAWESKSDSLMFIRELHSAGYATDPHYADKIEAVFHRVQATLAADASDIGS